MAKSMLPRIPEKAEQAHIVQLTRSLGGHAYVLGTKRKKSDFQGTCQTAGVPDLLLFLPRRPEMSAADPGWKFLVVECKGRGGRLRTEQALFAKLCGLADITHLVGGFDDFIAWLAARGYVKTEQFPTYRQQRSTP